MTSSVLSHKQTFTPMRRDGLRRWSTSGKKNSCTTASGIPVPSSIACKLLLTVVLLA